MKPAKKGVILVHGFLKSPQELNNIAERLRAKNITVHCPALPGHGECSHGHTACVFEMVKSDLTGWKKKIEDVFLKVKSEVDEIYVGGNSIGACIAIWLANKHKVNGLVLMSCPIVVSRVIAVGTKSFAIASKFIKNGSGGLPDIVSASVLNLIDIKSIFKEIQIILPKINIPTLIIHSKRDKVVLPKSAIYIYKRLGSPQKKLVWIDSNQTSSTSAYHELLSPDLSDAVAEEIGSFIGSNGNS